MLPLYELTINGNQIITWLQIGIFFERIIKAL